jgi:hypothetical protein
MAEEVKDDNKKILEMLDNLTKRVTVMERKLDECLAPKGEVWPFGPGHLGNCHFCHSPLPYQRDGLRACIMTPICQAIAVNACGECLVKMTKYQHGGFGIDEFHCLSCDKHFSQVGSAAAGCSDGQAVAGP